MYGKESEKSSGEAEGSNDGSNNGYQELASKGRVVHRFRRPHVCFNIFVVKWLSTSRLTPENEQ